MSFRGLAMMIACLGTIIGAQAQGNYAPVVNADLIGAKFNHYYNAKNKAVIPPDFAWSFSSSNLVIQATNHALPAVLLEELAVGQKDVKRIEAEWKIEAGKLVVKDMKLDGKAASKEVELWLARTAPTVIRIGAHQFVFTPKR